MKHVKLPSRRGWWRQASGGGTHGRRNNGTPSVAMAAIVSAACPDPLGVCFSVRWSGLSVIAGGVQSHGASCWLSGGTESRCVCVCVVGHRQKKRFAVTASPCPCGADGARPWLAGLATTTCSHAAAPWVAYTCRQPERRPSGGKPVKRVGEACRVGLLWARLLGGSSQRRSRPGGGPQAHARGRGSFQSGKRRLSAGGTDGSRQHRRSGEEGGRVTCAGRAVY